VLIPPQNKWRDVPLSGIPPWSGIPRSGTHSNSNFTFTLFGKISWNGTRKTALSA
jgi:hypothetical protein